MASVVASCLRQFLFSLKVRAQLGLRLLLIWSGHMVSTRVLVVSVSNCVPWIMRLFVRYILAEVLLCVRYLLAGALCPLVDRRQDVSESIIYGPFQFGQNKFYCGLHIFLADHSLWTSFFLAGIHFCWLALISVSI